MPLSALLAPIAAATVLNVFLCALAWRGTQIEKARGGKTPWPFTLGLITYAGGLGLFIYLAGDRPLTTGPAIFMTALAAESMGALLVWGLLHAFVETRGEPWGDRAFPILVSIGLTALFFGATFLA